MAKRTKKSEKDQIKDKQDKEKSTQEAELNNNEQDKAENIDDKKEAKSKKDEKKSDSGDDLEQKLQELQDRYLRLSAEFDNYRKRTLKEKADLSKSAAAEVLMSVLPVMDDFERGMETLKNATSIEAVQEGMSLIYTKLKDFVKQNGVKEIEAMEQEFDTDEHEAVTKIPAPKEELKGKVVDVVQKGYKLNDRIIRYAKVVVGE